MVRPSAQHVALWLSVASLPFLELGPSPVGHLGGLFRVADSTSIAPTSLCGSVHSGRQLLTTNAGDGEVFFFFNATVLTTTTNAWEGGNKNITTDHQ